MPFAPGEGKMGGPLPAFRPMSAADPSRFPTALPPAWTTKDGRTVRIRALQPGDAGPFGEFLRSLSFGTRYFRFGRGDFDLTDAQLRDVCDPDPGVRRYVVTCDGVGGESHIAAGSIYLVPEDSACELAILVSDAWQGTRVAHRLLGHLIRTARDCGCREMRAQVLGTNRRMLGFARRNGFRPATTDAASPIVDLRLAIGPPDFAALREE